MKNFFYSLIRFVIALFFILLGIVCVMIPWSGEIRYYVIRLILEGSALLSIFGSAFIIIGASIVAYIILNMRPRYYKIKCGNQTALVDEVVLLQYLAIYWKQLFPDQEVHSRVYSKQGKIGIAVDLPFTPLDEQLTLLKRIQEDLEHLLSTKIGYDDLFHLSARFNS